LLTSISHNILCVASVGAGGYANGVYADGSDDDDVELLAVDSPLRSSNHNCRSRRVGGVLRLRSSSDGEDDALLSLEHELTQSELLTYLFILFFS